MEKNTQPRQETPVVDLGIDGWRAPIHSHIAYLWGSESDFASAVGFVDVGLRGADHCVVIGGPEDNERVLAVLEARSLDVEDFQRRRRLIVIARASTGRGMLDQIAAACDQAVADGAAVVRLFGLVGWGREVGAPDAEHLSCEAQVIEIAEKYPLVILCLHKLHSLTGLIARYGVFATHPQMLEERGVLANPFFVPPHRFAERLLPLAGQFSQHQLEREALRRKTEILEVISDRIPIMIVFTDASGRLIYANREWERIHGLTTAEAQRIDMLQEFFPEPEQRRKVLEFIRSGVDGWADFRSRAGDGRMLETSWLAVTLSDGTRMGFGQDITDRKRSEEALRALSERLRVVREEESARIAREVHDEVGQALTALQMDAAWLEKQLSALGQPAAKNLLAKVRSMLEQIDTTLDAVQRIATELRPGVLDELGLEAGIEWYVKDFERRTGIAGQILSNLDGARLDPGPATAVFRIIQEALTNVARHSAATRVQIDLSADAERFVFEVRDDGRGIPAEKIDDSRSLGLLGMRERARAIGGELEIRKGEEGTVIRLTIPR